MRISQQGLNFLKKEEGVRLNSYRDAVGVWTIGYGSTGPHVRPGMSISQQEAEDLLREDLERFENTVAKNVKVDINQNEFDAMVSLAFNIGTGGFAKSSVVKRLNKGDKTGAAEAFKMWSRAGNKPLLLRKRREREITLFTSGQGETILQGGPIRDPDPVNKPDNKLAISKPEPIQIVREIDTLDEELEPIIITPETIQKARLEKELREKRIALKGNVPTQGFEDLLSVD